MALSTGTIACALAGAVLFATSLHTHAQLGHDPYQVPRRICRDQGGEFVNHRCVLPQPPPNSERGERRRGGSRIIARNYGVCDARIAIAYVPMGRSEHVASGWWTARSGAYFELEDDGKPVVHDPRHESYFYIEKLDGRPVRNFPRQRDFTIGGRTIGFTRHTVNMLDGNDDRWIELVCQP